jgi:hypothetical protein
MASETVSAATKPAYAPQGRQLTSEILKFSNPCSVVWTENKTIKTWLAHFICTNFDEPSYPEEILQLIPTAEKKTGNGSATLSEAVTTFVESFVRGKYRLGAPNQMRWFIRKLREPGVPSRRLLTDKVLQKACEDRLAKPLGTDRETILAAFAQALDWTDPKGMGPLINGALHKKIQNCCQQFSEVAKLNALISETKISNFLEAKNYRQTLSEFSLLALVEYLAKAGFLAIDDAGNGPTQDDRIDLSRALTKFLAIESNSQHDFSAAAVGKYWLYRPSAHIEGYVVKAKFEVMQHKSSGATGTYVTSLLTMEQHAFGAEGEAGHYKENFGGVMLRKATMPTIISCRTSMKESAEGVRQSVSRGAPRFMLITRTTYSEDGNGVAGMSGITVATFAGGEAKSLPVIIERVSKEDDGRWHLLTPNVYPQDELAEALNKGGDRSNCSGRAAYVIPRHVVLRLQEAVATKF